MTDRHKAKARQIVAGMKSWFRDFAKRHKKGDARDRRTREDCVFDSGVFAAAEFVRRFTGDETLSGMIHQCSIWAQKESARQADAATVLREAAKSNGTPLSRDSLEGIYRAACAATHPDVGGSAETFKRVQTAKAALDKYFSGK